MLPITTPSNLTSNLTCRWLRIRMIQIEFASQLGASQPDGATASTGCSLCRRQSVLLNRTLATQRHRDGGLFGERRQPALAWGCSRILEATRLLGRCSHVGAFSSPTAPLDLLLTYRQVACAVFVVVWGCCSEQAVWACMHAPLVCLRPHGLCCGAAHRCHVTRDTLHRSCINVGRQPPQSIPMLCGYVH